MKLPAVFKAPIRPDIVSHVHSDMRKNARQPYAVAEEAGMSWKPLKYFLLNFFLSSFNCYCSQVIRHLLNHGELVGPLLVYLECVAVEVSVQDKGHMETCARAGACLRRLKPGEDGTDTSTPTRKDMLCALLLLRLLFLHW